MLQLILASEKKINKHPGTKIKRKIKCFHPLLLASEQSLWKVLKNSEQKPNTVSALQKHIKAASGRCLPSLYQSRALAFLVSKCTVTPSSHLRKIKVLKCITATSGGKRKDFHTPSSAPTQTELLPNVILLSGFSTYQGVYKY